MLIIRNLLHYIVSFYPEDIQKKAAREIPRLAIQAGRLALEVVDAEGNGLRYMEAVLDPNYPLMARMHFGLADTLRWRVPEEMKPAVQKLLHRAAEGDFDPLRQVVFALGSRKDPLAAACRFVTWNAIYLNLLILTENKPGVEVIGALDECADEAQTILMNLLGVPEMYEDDVRPLSVLLAQTIQRLQTIGSRRLQALFAQPLHDLEAYLSATEARATVRQLDSDHVSLFWPGRGRGGVRPGDAQTVDRYPNHYKSVSDLQQQRSRFLKELRKTKELPEAGDRLIDIFQAFMKEEEVMP